MKNKLSVENEFTLQKDMPANKTGRDSINYLPNGIDNPVCIKTSLTGIFQSARRILLGIIMR